MFDPVAFRLGPLAVRWYGIVIGAALALGTFLSLREARRQGVEEDFMLDLYLRVIPAAIIGGRLYYVIFTWDYYRNNLLQIFAIRSGGMAIHGAILEGLLVGYILQRGANNPSGSYWILWHPIWF